MPELRVKWPALVDEVECLKVEVERIVSGSARLIGTLFSFDQSRDYVPPYNAISYTWGAAVATDKIWLSDDHYLPLISSPAYVLRRTKYEWVWIDSVCINRNDLQEKSEQVLRVWRIYNAAKLVTVWLGDLDDGADDVPKFIEDDDDAFNGGRRSCARSRWQKMSDSLSERSPDWRSMDRLLRHPWSTRCWIMQEVSLATAVEVTCGGEESISWRALSNFVGYLQRKLSLQAELCKPRDEVHAALREQDLGIATDGAIAVGPTISADVSDAREEERVMSGAASRANNTTPVPVGAQSSPRSARQPNPISLPPSLNAIAVIEKTKSARRTMNLYTLQHQVLSTAEFQATDDRDRIYALLSCSFDGLGGAGILLNYSLTAREIFCAVIEYFVVRDKELLVLHIAGIGFGSPSNLSGLPTWVPDYTHACRRTFANGRITILGRYTDRYYRACTKIYSDVPVEVYLRKLLWDRGLSVKGIDIDTVKCALTPPAAEKGVYATLNAGTAAERAALLEWFQDLEVMWFSKRPQFSPYKVPYGRPLPLSATLPTLMRVLLRVLIGGEAQFSLADEADHAMSDMSMYRPLLSFLRESIAADSQVSTFAETGTLNDQIPDLWQQLSPAERERAQHFAQRMDELSDWCVFVTKSGRLGCGPPLTKAGDCVVVFWGGRTPFLLRALSW